MNENPNDIQPEPVMVNNRVLTCPDGLAFDPAPYEVRLFSDPVFKPRGRLCQKESHYPGHEDG